MRSTGRVVGSLRASWLRVEGHWAWYRRHWMSSLCSSGLRPLLFLLAMGIGFGSQVRAGRATGGESYLHYVAPALLVAGALQNAVGGSSYPVLSGFKWQKDYIAVTATPITPGQLLGGHLIWEVLRLGLASGVYALIAFFFGAWTNAGALLVIPVGVLTGVSSGSLVAALAATMYGEGTGFNTLFRFVVMPMTLFAGTFFPVAQLPGVIEPVAWISPLWHGNELARGATLGGAESLAVLGHLGYLFALLGIGIFLARQRFYRRLVA